jgi:hypothetical protein
VDRRSSTRIDGAAASAPSPPAPQRPPPRCLWICAEEGGGDCRLGSAPRKEAAASALDLCRGRLHWPAAPRPRAPSPPAGAPRPRPSPLAPSGSTAPLLRRPTAPRTPHPWSARRRALCSARPCSARPPPTSSRKWRRQGQRRCRAVRR